MESGLGVRRERTMHRFEGWQGSLVMGGYLLVWAANCHSYPDHLSANIGFEKRVNAPRAKVC